MLGNPMMAVMLVSGNPGSKWWIFQPRLRPEGRPEAMRYEFVVSWQERPQRGDSLISVVDQTGPHLIRGMLQRDLLDSRLEWFFRLDPLNTLDITTMLQLTSQHPFFLRQSAYISQNKLTSKTGSIWCQTGWITPLDEALYYWLAGQVCAEDAATSDRFLLDRVIVNPTMTWFGSKTTIVHQEYFASIPML